MTRVLEPREGEEGGGERIGKPGGCGERPILRERFFVRWFFPFFSEDERESSCRAVSMQADFVTHVLPSVT